MRYNCLRHLGLGMVRHVRVVVVVVCVTRDYVQPLKSSLVRVKTVDAIVQFVDETRLHHVEHRLSVTTGTQRG